MTLKFYLIIGCILFSVGVYAQNPAISNQRMLGGTATESAAQLIPTPDNSGYILFGESNSGISGTKTEANRGLTDLWIQKVDLNLDPVWDKTYGGSEEDRLFEGLIYDNKIYVLSSSNSSISGDKTMNSFGDYDVWLLCLDLNGNLLWQTQYGGNLEEYGGDIIALQNGDLLIAATSRSPISGNKTEPVFLLDDIWLIEISVLDGTIVQQKVINSDGSDYLPSLAQSSLNQAIYVSCMSSGGSSTGDRTDLGYGGDDAWVVKLDENLIVLQDKCFGGTNLEQRPLIYGIDGFFYISCRSNSVPSGNKTAPFYGGASFPTDSWLVKMDSDMNILWDHSYGGYDSEFSGVLFKNQNGKLVYSCSSKSIVSGNKTAPKYGDYDSWLLILNDDGSILAQETYGGSNYDAGMIYPAIGSNNQLVLSGASNSPISGTISVPIYGQRDVWLAKLDASDFLNTVELEGTNSAVSVYPNPFRNDVNFKFTDLKENLSLKLYSLEGKLIHCTEISTGTIDFNWSATSSESILIYELTGETINHKGKLVRF